MRLVNNQQYSKLAFPGLGPQPPTGAGPLCVQGLPASATAPSLQPDKLRRVFFTDKKHKS